VSKNWKFIASDGYIKTLKYDDLNWVLAFQDIPYYYYGIR
jgi:hypothetical protein